LLTLINALQPLYIVNIAVGLTLALCVTFVATGRDRELLFWASGFALYALAFTLFGVRTEIPNVISVVGGNASMTLMFALFTEGLCRLYGFNVSRWFIWAVPLLGVVGFGWLANDFDGRIALGVVVTIYHSILVLYLVIRSLHSADGRGKWIIFTAVAGYALMFLVRAALITAGISQGDSFLAPGVEQSIYFSIATVSIVMFAIGLLVNYKERAETAAWQQAHHDPLTSVGNRRVLQQRLRLLSQQPSETTFYCGLTLLDLDHFKELNDTYGHALGDQLLIHVAERLKSSVSSTDAVIRLGGDEFVILLERLDTDAHGARDKAMQVASRVLDQISQPYQLKTTDADTGELKFLNYQISASIGVEIFSCAGFDREDVLRAADVAMYKAKQSGRNAIYCDEIET
tara:strand:- start:76775 stop:77980 length:1206 start_codon:yes stop_codon:yes gene_type:complete